jgi:RNA polymerase sigma factor (sigma-70 family)
MGVLGLAGPVSSSTGDKELVAACLAGEQTGWSELVRRYRPLVFSIARDSLRKYGADDPASLGEDVANEVFTELMVNDGKALSRFREPFSLRAWLGVITRRKASRMLKGARRAPLGLEEPGYIPADNRTIASDVAEVEQLHSVRDHLMALSPRDRLALQLFYESGRSYKEVAEVLELPVNRIGTLLARARKRLAKAMGIDE